jgi:hypothetical protein
MIRALRIEREARNASADNLHVILCERSGLVTQNVCSTTHCLAGAQIANLQTKESRARR